jgi:hypothetical protein
VRGTRRLAWLVLASAALCGCGGGALRSGYGHVRGSSLNGVGAFAALLGERGHDVRTIDLLEDSALDGADVVIRFAPYAGPPDRREWDAYVDWLADSAGRRLIYVARDHDAEADYWDSVIAALPESAAAERRRAEAARRAAGDGREVVTRARPEDVDVADWFRIERGTGEPVVVEPLEGPWAEGIDAKAARLLRRDVLRDDSGGATASRLRGPDTELVLEYTLDALGGGNALIVANGSFLLNAALLNPARRALAIRTADWIEGDGPRRVVFVEGAAPWDEEEALGEGGLPTGLSLWSRLERLRWVAGHWIAFAVLACLAAAVRLGRPRPEPASGLDRPSAHAEALGDLIARTGDRDAARAILARYRRWRQGRRDEG